jgi:hypothetical protein
LNSTWLATPRTAGRAIKVPQPPTKD